MKIKYILEAFLVSFISLLVVLLPHKLALKLGSAFGTLTFYLWGSRRKIAVDNIVSLNIFTNDPISICKESFKNFGKSLVEILKIYYGLGLKIIDSVEIRGIEHYKRAKSKGKGIIFITGHCGNWELMAITVGSKIEKTAIVVREQNNPFFNKFIEKIRSKYGNKIIYKKGALKSILAELRINHPVGILMDQAVLSNEGFIIDFLGKPAWTTKMPALIARKTGAAVLPIFISREGFRHKIKIYPEITLSPEVDFEKAIVEDTKNFSKYIEEYIKANPTEWLWIHRRWKRVESK
ncbi:MAG: lysophospholipid acyltransferase family protein [Thermodesulfovibrionales bacterium]|nr:lysophospholipid acyltransferase family protein [Thermodesulfovibrionales bacterium]